MGGTDSYVLRKFEDYCVFFGNCFCENVLIGDVLSEFERGERKMEHFVLH